jgi:hypothetical protein
VYIDDCLFFVHQRSTFDDVIQALSKTFILQDQSNASVYKLAWLSTAKGKTHILTQYCMLTLMDLCNGSSGTADLS